MRRDELDYARGIAILMILIGHTYGLSAIEDKIIYSFHVPSFFVISGILLSHKQIPNRKWGCIGDGWLRHIIIPMLFWECVLSLFYYFLKNIPFTVLLANSLSLNFNLSVLWFIPCLLISETIWILINKTFLNQVSLPFSIFWMIFFAVIAECCCVLFIKRIFIGIVFVICGFSFDKAQQEYPPSRKDYFRMALFFGIIWVCSTAINTRVDMSIGKTGNTLLYYFHSASGSLLLITICNLMPSGFAPLSWVGRNSFGFLVTHVFVRHIIVAAEESLFNCLWEGWALAIPVVLLDAAAVWIIGLIAPEIFGQKRLR